jgi:hypothetical protein
MARLKFNEAEQAKLDQATALENQAKELKEQAFEDRRLRDCARDDKDRLIFAATWRCPCGHGMAYDPAGKLGGNTRGPFKMPSQWECSAILLGEADKNLIHNAPHPFAFYEAKSEDQPSAGGMTTRTPAEPSEDAHPKNAA